MKELEITKGEWNQCCEDTKPHFVFAGEDKTICGLRSNEPGTENYEPLEGIVTTVERRANAALIADAGNTYQDCHLLPSELLKQRDGFRKGFKALVKERNQLREKIKRLEFMIENGLGPEDMRNDITMPHEI